MPDRVPLAAMTAHGLRRQTVVQSVLADVFEGRLKTGTHLVTQDLARRFGVSHTPIREALITLAGIGIVDLLPNRGAVVRRVTAVEVREVCQVRRLLECAAVRSACGRISRDQLESLAADLRAIAVADGRDGAARINRTRDLDSRLHDVIAESCGNGFLAKEINRLTILFRAFRDIAWQRDEARSDFRRVPGETREHLAIVDALLAADPTRAARAMARHIRSGLKYWSRVVRSGAPTAAGAAPPTSPSRKGTHP